MARMATAATMPGARSLTVDEILGDLGPTKSGAIYTKAWDSFMSFLSDTSDRKDDADEVPKGGDEAPEGGNEAPEGGDEAPEIRDNGGDDIEAVPTEQTGKKFGRKKSIFSVDGLDSDGFVSLRRRVSEKAIFAH
jgi:hypothetical protein